MASGERRAASGERRAASEQIASAATVRSYIEANFQLQAPTTVTPGETLVPTEQEAEWAIRSGCF